MWMFHSIQFAMNGRKWEFFRHFSYFRVEIQKSHWAILSFWKHLLTHFDHQTCSRLAAEYSVYSRKVQTYSKFRYRHRFPSFPSPPQEQRVCDSFTSPHPRFNSFSFISISRWYLLKSDFSRFCAFSDKNCSVHSSRYFNEAENKAIACDINFILHNSDSTWCEDDIYIYLGDSLNSTMHAIEMRMRGTTSQLDRNFVSSFVSVTLHQTLMIFDGPEN